MERRNAAPAPNRPRKRRPLTRQYVLERALAYVDDHGLAALTMRRLGAALGVEGMSLYKHVADKDALLDGIVELLWAQAPAAAAPGTHWKDALRDYAEGLRSLFGDHPNSAPLIIARNYINQQMLRRYETYANLLQEQGFDRPSAIQAIGAVTGMAFGFGLVELRYRDSAAGSESEVQRIRHLTRTLPADLPDSQIELAVELTSDPRACDTCFAISLEAVLSGLNERRRT